MTMFEGWVYLDAETKKPTFAPSGKIYIRKRKPTKENERAYHRLCWGNPVVAVKITCEIVGGVDD